MKRVVALLATVLGAAALVACGSGAEPGAPERATLVLDFQPNAAHAGIYAALVDGFYEDAGVELTIQQPLASTDAPKLLEAGKAQFAILDIHDLAIASERGFDLVGVMPIVQRPLASVIAGDREAVRRPRDLEGRTVGVTGLPSDDAVLDSVVAADGAIPEGRPGDDRLQRGRGARRRARRRRNRLLECRGGDARAPGHSDPRLPGRRLRRSALPGVGVGDHTDDPSSTDPSLVSGVVQCHHSWVRPSGQAPRGSPARSSGRGPQSRSRRPAGELRLLTRPWSLSTTGQIRRGGAGSLVAGGRSTTGSSIMPPDVSRLVRPALGRLGEQTGGELGHLARHPRSRDDDVHSRRLGPLSRFDVRVGVEAEDGRTRAARHPRARGPGRRPGGRRPSRRCLGDRGRRARRRARPPSASPRCGWRTSGPAPRRRFAPCRTA